MRVVVVGATGNVGSALVRRLRSADDVEVVGVARHAPEAAPPFDGVPFVPIDVGDPDVSAALEEAFSGADAVVHLAWLLQPNHDEATMRRTNVDGTARVLEAVAAAGVAQVVVASSVGAYSPGPKRRVDESYPANGIPTSHYGRHKGANERAMDDFERRHPGITVTRLRPGLVMQGAVGLELRRLFIGPLIPVRWLEARRLPLLPLPPQVVSQVVHADDLAEAVLRILQRRAGGAFNLATEPVVGPRQLARVLRGRWLPVPSLAVRGLLRAAWRAHLVRADPGWLDLACSVPLMSTERARTELGWVPRIRADDALAEAIEGIARGDVLPQSPHLS